MKVKGNIIVKDKKGNILKEYETIDQAVKGEKISYSTLYRGIRKVYKNPHNKRFYEIKKDEVEAKQETKQEEVITQKKKEYFINILVGLANNTLVDGATYDVNGTLLKYSKKDNALKLNDKVFYSKDAMFSMVEMELPILSSDEREFLSNLLKAFKSVKGVIKCKDRIKGFEFIRIETNSEEDNITLPSFVANKYYKNLQLDRLYTLEELGL